MGVCQPDAGIGPGVSPPDDWNLIDSDGARGVVPSWSKPPKSRKDARKLQGKPPREAEGWVPTLSEANAQRCIIFMEYTEDPPASVKRAWKWTRLIPDLERIAFH